MLTFSQTHIVPFDAYYHKFKSKLISTYLNNFNRHGFFHVTQSWVQNSRSTKGHTWQTYMPHGYMAWSKRVFRRSRITTRLKEKYALDHLNTWAHMSFKEDPLIRYATNNMIIYWYLLDNITYKVNEFISTNESFERIIYALYSMAYLA